MSRRAIRLKRVYEAASASDGGAGPADPAFAFAAQAGSPAMNPEEYVALLSQLLEAERAGAKLLAAYLGELPPDSSGRNALRAVKRDEARNCAVLMDLFVEAEAMPTPAVGSFYGRGMAIRGWRDRLEFLNRGQAWVAKRIAAALPRVPDTARRRLQDMHDSHLTNIGGCEALLRTLRA